MLMTVMTMTIVILMALYVVKNMLVCSDFMEYLQLMYVCTYIHIYKFVLFLYLTFNFLPEVSITRMAKKIHHEEEFIYFYIPQYVNGQNGICHLVGCVGAALSRLIAFCPVLLHQTFIIQLST